ncbi:MAG TPA: CDP-alcohol phosphatidyltransferase family protein [Sphingomicrobium sp.]|nr:CDP-alcohol phosphatidyltransferase family protein [Sphingomicrobium sp.]
MAHASAVMDDAALSWLIENRGTIVGSVSGLPLAVSVEPGRSIDASALDGKIVVPAGEQFVRKLRRRVELAAHSLADEPLRSVEKKLFGNVYKGVTDVVTKYAWPRPAFHVTRAISRIGITPNMVTSVGLVMVFIAAWFFYRGELAAGLAAAWLMTFLDTVDGKLARVTVTSSAFGNLLDHGTDIIHPPIWWYCLAHGVAAIDPAQGGNIWAAFWIILGCYVVGRIVEIAFHRLFGFNQYIWKRFDSRFRLIVSRRNIILLIMTAGLIVGATTGAFLLCAAWSIVSTIIQVVRIGQAHASRPITSWLY